MVFDDQDRFIFEVIVVLQRFVNNSLDDVGEGMEPFEEHVHQLATSDRVPCFAGQHFKVADVLVDVWEVEGETVEAGLRYLLLCRISELGLESGQEVCIGVLDVVVDRVQLFESFEDALHPSVDLGAFDKGERDCYAPNRGFESRYPLVGHHIDLEFACYGAAPTQGQRSPVNDQEGLGSQGRGREVGRHTGLTEG